MKIYIARHGETEWNKIGRCQGWLDSPLTENGVKSAEKLGREIKDIKFDRVFTSDLARAYITAEIAVPDYEVTKTQLLREINMGIWGGNEFSDIEKDMSQKYYEFFNEPEKFNIREGETFGCLMNRIERFFREYIEQQDYDNVLIVCHGIIMAGLFNYIQNIPVEKFWSNKVSKNGELNIIEYNNGEFCILKKADDQKYDETFSRNK